jgi:hypothetical protein
LADLEADSHLVEEGNQAARVDILAVEDIQVDPEEDNRLVGEDSRADLVEGNHLVEEGNQAA